MPGSSIGVGVRVRERGVHEPPLRSVGAVVGGGTNERMTELETIGVDVQQTERLDLAEIALGETERAERGQYDPSGARAVRCSNHRCQAARC